MIVANSIFTHDTELLPLPSCWRIVENKSLFTVFLLFHTDSNEKSIFLKFPARDCIFPLQCPLHDPSQKLRANVSNVHYLQTACPTLSSQPSNQQGNLSEVLSRAGIQNLNKLIKSWGDSETEQLSGLLAVHGWSVPCKGTRRLGLSPQKHLAGLEHHKAFPNLQTTFLCQGCCVRVCVCTRAQREGRIWGWVGCRKK